MATRGDDIMLWRPMEAGDLGAVSAIADRVHAAFPEDPEVFAERLALHPAGCRVLAARGGVAGYVVSHPWHLGRPPALNARLGAIPASATTCYLHDLALLPEARGTGTASAVVRDLLAQAQAAGFATASLVAVHASGPFWARHGFAAVDDAVVAEKLRSYGEDARLMVRPLRSGVRPVPAAVADRPGSV